MMGYEDQIVPTLRKREPPPSSSLAVFSQCAMQLGHMKLTSNRPRAGIRLHLSPPLVILVQIPS